MTRQIAFGTTPERTDDVIAECQLLFESNPRFSKFLSKALVSIIRQPRAIHSALENM
jgi:hypothetical protein